ncbi:MAG TPA: Flp family type IVb pilin [Nitrospira sp.]|nr:Flp family type IVb pilin [Nitrospira sp.]
MLKAFGWFVRDEEGASAAEYALLLVAITLGLVGAINLLGANITTAITNAAGCVIGGACGS